jgi:hypothetical protein
MIAEMLGKMTRFNIYMLLYILVIVIYGCEGCDSGCDSQEGSGYYPDETPDDIDASESTDGGSGDPTSILGLSDSRYEEEPIVLRVLSVIRNPLDIEDRAQIRFTSEDPDRHADGAFAMAASASLNRYVDPGEIRDWFCHDLPSCRPRDYIRSTDNTGRTSPIRVSQVILSGPVDSREKGLSSCETDTPRLIKFFRDWVQSGRSGVVTVYAQGGFKDLTDGQEGDQHAFALDAVDSDGTIYLRDAADLYPVTYALPSDHLCKALVGPTVNMWSHRLPVVDEWTIIFYKVEPADVEQAGPDPQPPNPDPEPVFPDGGTLARDPSIVLPGKVGSDPFDIGVFTMPSGVKAPFAVTARGLSERPPRALFLRYGASKEVRFDAENRVRSFEKLWKVRGVKNGFFSEPPVGSRNRDVFTALFQQLREEEGSLLQPLIDRLQAARESLGKSRDWLLVAIICMVQNMPYELIRENTVEVRSPVATLSRGGGDCDSKSLLAAILLHLAGYQVGVVSSSREKHAMLAILLDQPTGATITVGDRVYTIVEMTALRPIGQVTVSRTQRRVAALGRGWVFHGIE